MALAHARGGTDGVDALRYLRDALTATTARISGYDWNADPDDITRQQGDAFAAADKVLADLSAAVDAHPDIDLPECETCGGTGKIEEPARTTGTNQHSACIRDCDECDGCGFAPDRPHAPVSHPGDGVEIDERTGHPTSYSRTPPAEPVSRLAGEGEREAVARIIRQHVKVDATGLAPAIASVFMVGIEEAADAILSLLSPAAPDAGGEV